MTPDSSAKGHEVTSGTREWADHNVNCVKGCRNNCRYCYAKIMAKRFGRSTEHTWKNMVVNRRAVNFDFRKFRGRVMFPSSHDIVDTREVKDACFTVIKKLLISGNDVLVTTKPSLSVTKDIVMTFLDFRSQLQFRFTITSLDDTLLSFWEPNAPRFEERLESLKHACAARFKTSVSIEPFLDYDPRGLVDTVLPYVTESIWIGPMNYIPRNAIMPEHEQRYTDIRRACKVPHLREIYEDLKDIPQIRFKDSMRNRLSPQGTCL
ncbi:MAG: radical SAM protein [Candidatus Binatia bacterium]